MCSLFVVYKIYFKFVNCDIHVIYALFMFVFICICAGSSLLCGLFSSCGEWGLFFVLVQKLLIGLDSPAAEHGLQGRQASAAEVHGLSSCGSQALEHRLSSCGP